MLLFQYYRRPFFCSSLYLGENKVWFCLVFFPSFLFRRTNVTGVSRAHQSDGKIRKTKKYFGRRGKMDLSFFCGKTPPRNHTISIKGMLLCWLDVKRPCVLYQNGEESSEQPEWADQGGQTRAPHALAPFCCLMFLATQFPFSRKPCR